MVLQSPLAAQFEEEVQGHGHDAEQGEMSAVHNLAHDARTSRIRGGEEQEGKAAAHDAEHQQP